MDIFKKLKENRGPLGQYQKSAHGYFIFPKLEGEIGPRMNFRGKPVLNWSLNNYLGLANHPEIREIDAQAAKDWGMAAPMGARMMSGQTKYHEKLESDLAEFVGKRHGYLLNYGYQGMISIIDSLVDRHDVIVYDSEDHACIFDGLRLHMGKRFIFGHNDMDSCEKQLQRATKIVEETKGGILVITEGVFGMAGDLGNLKAITDLKDKYDFRLLVDDAHGFGTMGANGKGTHEHYGVIDKVDLYFSTFAKAMAGIGAFIASNDDEIIDILQYNMRSQIFAKSLPMPMVIGGMKRLEMLKTRPELRHQLWTVANRLQNGFKERGFDIGKTQSCVTPVYMKGTVAESTNMIMDMRENHGVFCSIVVYPVVPKDVVMLRVIPTAAHTIEDVDYTLDVFSKMKEKLENNFYDKVNIGSLKVH